MTLFELKFFKKGNKGICAEDFKSEDNTEKINLEFILSLSSIQKFRLPLSGSYTGDTFAVVTMSNNDKYYIRGETYYELVTKLPKTINY